MLLFEIKKKSMETLKDENELTERITKTKKFGKSLKMYKIINFRLFAII